MAKTKILVVDDDENVRDLIQLFLEREQYTVITAGDGKSALYWAKNETLDLIILDLTLPDIDGIEVCKEIFQRYKIPIVMLTARTELMDKVRGYNAGTDDYLTKPFESLELIARVKAVLRRKSNDREPKEIRLYDLKIEVDNKRVTKNEVEIQLTKKEFELLVLLAENPKKVFEREDLLSKVWEYDFVGDARVVDTCITRLRKKIEDDSANPKYIMTAHGMGYRFGGKEE